MGVADSVYNVLKHLVELYSRTQTPVKSRDIATALGIHEGYVRNMLSILKSMGLVASKAGPHGGYVPTSKAMDMLTRQTFSIPITSMGNVVGYALDVTIVGLLTERPHASMRVIGDLSPYLGREVRVGPLPSGLVFIGRVIRADLESLVEITSVVSLPHIPVKDIMTRNPVTARPGDRVRDFVPLFSRRRFRSVPVVDDAGRPVGLLISSRVMEALAECRLDVRVEEIMMRDPPIIDEDEDLHEAVRTMVSSGIGRLLVINEDGILRGIVTRTDILSRIAAIEELV